MSTILITGGTGLIGNLLAQKLVNNGFEVRLLSRTKSDSETYKTYIWDVKNQTIDKESLNGVDFIIHLAGAGIAEKSWSEKRKKEIIDSRVDSTNLLYNALSTHPNQVKSIVCASAIGYYGGDTGNILLNEDSKPRIDFLAHVTKLWEQASIQFQSINIRTVLIRIGVVLSDKGGALPKIAMPIKLGAGAYLGSGEQYISWIHIEDLCEIFITAIKNNQINGAYNAVASVPVTNKVFTNAVAKSLKRLVLPFNIPKMVLRLILGEMSIVVLGGSRVSNEKILKTGFKFKFNTIETALNDFYK